MFVVSKKLVSVLMLGLFFTACGEGDSGSKKVESKEIVVTKEVESIEQAPEQIATDTTEVVEEVAPPVEATVEKTVATNPVTHKVNAQARIFKPDTIYINPGDTVQWVNMTSHNTASVDGLIPEGTTPWQSKLGENLKIKLDVVGIYAYVCQPHIGFGMVGVIVVGKPSNLDDVMEYATTKLEGPYRRLIGKLKKVKIP